MKQEVELAVGQTWVGHDCILVIDGLSGDEVQVTIHGDKSRCFAYNRDWLLNHLDTEDYRLSAQRFAWGDRVRVKAGSDSGRRRLIPLTGLVVDATPVRGSSRFRYVVRVDADEWNRHGHGRTFGSNETVDFHYYEPELELVEE